jgi:hypothetical protein
MLLSVLVVADRHPDDIVARLKPSRVKAQVVDVVAHRILQHADQLAEKPVLFAGDVEPASILLAAQDDDAFRRKAGREQRLGGAPPAFLTGGDAHHELSGVREGI